MSQEESEENFSQHNIVQRSSNEDIKLLMEKFNVSEEDVHVAIQIVGDYREKIEKYLANNPNSRQFNIW